MNYRKLYKELASELTNERVSVRDFDYLGHCGFNDGNIAYINIHPKMSYKEKFFTLIHEAGHLFVMKKGKIFNLSKRARTEQEANYFVVQYLNRLKIDVEEYYLFYNKAEERSKNRRKHWYEL